MCGLVGFIGGAISHDAGHSETVIKRMANSLKARGPDDEGIWIDADAGVCFGHRRLAVVEISALGHQPMVSSSGRYVIAFNGEVYNHLDIRAKLRHRGVQWRGHSDTETLLEGVEAWGITETLKASNGMFAIALWDRRDRILHLARDRVGEKPLYYGWQGQGDERTLVFGSELKALRKHSSFDAEIDREAVVQYMRFGYVPAPRSIYKKTFKVSPGTIISFDGSAEKASVQRYWSAIEAVHAGTCNPYDGDANDAVQQLHILLKDAVRMQMMADVPFGAFLSGGIDSSTIVALMQAQSSTPVHSFSIGFQEKEYDEAGYARAVAAHLGTQHTELYVSAKDALDVVPLLPQMYDEPFSDSSQIPTHMLSCLAREHVTVALSGDAGDELFGGYKRYALTQRFWDLLRMLPLSVRRPVGAAIRAVPENGWNAGARALRALFGAKLSYGRFGENVHKAARAMSCADLDELYLSLISLRQDPAAYVRGAMSEDGFPPKSMEHLTLSGVPRMMAIDLLTYLPDDILVKVDRAAMWSSLETRVPMLDHRVIEFAWQLPMQHKLRGSDSKWALKQVLFKYVPRHLVERPKMGFGIPVGQWLQGPLRGWAEDLLSEERIEREGVLNAAPVRRAWLEHTSGRINRQHELWNILMFQSWKQAVDAQLA